jgi:hypothetical protein
VPNEATFSGNFVRSWSIHEPATGLVTIAGNGKYNIDKKSRMSQYILEVGPGSRKISILNHPKRSSDTKANKSRNALFDLFFVGSCGYQIFLKNRVLYITHFVTTVMCEI